MKASFTWIRSEKNPFIIFFLSVEDLKNFEKKLRRSFFLHFVAVDVDAVAVVVVDDDDDGAVAVLADAVVANPAKNVSNLTARKQVWNNRLVSHINIPTFFHEMLEFIIFMHL